MIRQLTVLAVAVSSVAAVQAQNVYFEDRELYYSGNERPYNSRGTLLVPARRTAELIGGNLERDGSGRRIYLNWRGSRAEYVQGDHDFLLNGRRMSAGGVSEVRYDTLYVPYQIFRELTDGRFATNRGQGWGRNGELGRRRPGDPWERPNERYDPQYDRYDPRYDRNDPYNNQYGREQVFFDNRELRFDSREQPYLRNGVLMVPFRAMGDQIGARTERTEDGLRVWIYMNGDRVEYNKGHTWFRINSTRRELRTTSEDRGNVLFVPITLFEEIARGRVRVGRYY